MRTYYDVLGVASDTPDVVIKAAFRALAKEYHPDRAEAQSGDTDKFIEIQTAYAVLSKPDTRNEYDAELREAFYFDPPPAEAAPQGGALAKIPWGPVSHSTSDIERISARLGLYSDALAQSFHDAYLRGECGAEPWRFAEEMERSFFGHYFGDDPDIQALAKLLLLGSRTSAAQSLNQLVAGGFPPDPRDVRSVLTPIIEQDLIGETLFAEWLKVKFGLAPPPSTATPAAAEQPAAVAATVDVAPPAVPPAPTVAKPVPAYQGGNVLRSAGMVLIWAITLYFALFAALPMMH